MRMSEADWRAEGNYPGVTRELTDHELEAVVGGVGPDGIGAENASTETTGAGANPLGSLPIVGSVFGLLGGVGGLSSLGGLGGL
jgi:hypothetical protein